MTIDEWLVNRVITSTTITQYTTGFYPDLIPLDEEPPALVYKNIGFNRNLKERNQIFSITSYDNTKSGVENINDNLYNLFDASTGYIKETSSNIKVDSVEIINNGVSGYDDGNKAWFRVLDISVWYHK